MPIHFTHPKSLTLPNLGYVNNNSICSINRFNIHCKVIAKTSRCNVFLTFIKSFFVLTFICELQKLANLNEIIVLGNLCNSIETGRQDLLINEEK